MLNDRLNKTTGFRLHISFILSKRMSKRTAYILGSSRGDGETRLVVDEAMRLLPGDLIDLNDYNIGYYNYDHRYDEDDYLALMTRLVDDYDLLIFATPVYWYSMSAVMKTFFDRISDLLRLHKDIGRKLRGKEIALISCAYQKEMIKEFPLPFQRSANYLGMKYLDNVHGYVRSDELTPDVRQDIRRFVKTISDS